MRIDHHARLAAPTGRRLAIALLAAAALGGAARAQSGGTTGEAQGRTRDPAPPPADGAPAATPPVESGALGTGTPRRDDGAPAPVTSTRPGSTDATRMPPAGSAAPPGQSVAPGANPALGRGS